MHSHPFTLIFIGVLVLATTLQAQEEHGHQAANAHGHSNIKQVKAPKLFLDKSHKVIEYQLKRLSNEELLLAERTVDDPKYVRSTLPFCREPPCLRAIELLPPVPWQSSSRLR